MSLDVDAKLFYGKHCSCRNELLDCIENDFNINLTEEQKEEITELDFDNDGVDVCEISAYVKDGYYVGVDLGVLDNLDEMKDYEQEFKDRYPNIDAKLVLFETFY